MMMTSSSLMVTAPRLTRCRSCWQGSARVNHAGDRASRRSGIPAIGHPGDRAIVEVMELSPFRIERFYARYEHSTRFMLSSSDCESRTVADLLELEPGAQERLLECWCGYTEPPGAPGLRQAIASLYERTGPGEVVVTSCAEE